MGVLVGFSVFFSVVGWWNVGNLMKSFIAVAWGGQYHSFGGNLYFSAF